MGGRGRVEWRGGGVGWLSAAGFADRGGMLEGIKIKKESLDYEPRKHDGSLPMIDVNTFLPKDLPARLPPPSN